MICYRCGRELPEKSPFCKGCGQQFKRTQRVRPESLRTTLAREVPLGKKKVKAWRLLVRCALLCAALVVVIYAAPPLLKLLGSKIEDYTRPPVVYDPGSVVADISGTVIECGLPEGTQMTVESENAFADGSWQKDFRIDGGIRMRCLRRESAESWLNTHIYQLYPDVLEADTFQESPAVSGYKSARIQFRSQTYAPDCVIEALCVTVGGFDYIYVVEVPLEGFDEMIVEEWMTRLRLVDYDSGVEQINPASVPVVSSVDAV